VDVLIDMLGVAIAVVVARRVLSARATGTTPTGHETGRS
jgi:hypothetical protein